MTLGNRNVAFYVIGGSSTGGSVPPAQTDKNKLELEITCNTQLYNFSDMDFGATSSPIEFLTTVYAPNRIKYKFMIDAPTKIYIGPDIVDFAISVKTNIPSTVTDLSYMFESTPSSVKSLTSIEFTDVDTSNVTDMEGMFYGCGGLTTLDVSKFDTSSCENMQYMFASCDHMNGIDVSNFDTSKVLNMNNMFDSCGSEVGGTYSINVSGWDTSSCLEMASMFCNTLVKDLDLSSFDTSKVFDMWGMFLFCSQLETLNISNFNLDAIEETSGMFNYTNKLTFNNIDLSNCNTNTKALIKTAFDSRVN